MWVLMKSLRIVWLMVVGKLFFRKQFPLMSYAAALCITIGIVIFSFGEKRKGNSVLDESPCADHANEEAKYGSHAEKGWLDNVALAASTIAPSTGQTEAQRTEAAAAVKALAEMADTLYGLALSLTSMFFSSFKSYYQERLMTRYRVEHTDTILYCYGYGSAFVLPMLLFNGELTDSIRIFIENPYVLLNLCVSFFLSYAGIVFLLLLIQTSGAFVCTIVSSCRKILTVLL